MVFIRLLSAISVFLTLTGAEAAEPAAKQPRVITMVSDEWCPYVCGEKGDSGILIDLARMALAESAITVKPSLLPWARAVKETASGRYSAIAGATAADVEGFILPSVPQAMQRMCFYTLKESDWHYKAIESLETATVAAIVGYAYSEEMDAYIAANSADVKKIQLMPGDTAMAANMKKVLAGRVTAVLEDANVMSYQFLKNPDWKARMRQAGCLHVTPAYSELYIAFSPKQPFAAEMAATIAAYTKKIEKSGAMAHLFNKYGVDAPTVSGD